MFVLVEMIFDWKKKKIIQKKEPVSTGEMLKQCKSLILYMIEGCFSSLYS